ncbi:hypothetical protein DFAR_2690002 [Desulfarculales bacterium]
MIVLLLFKWFYHLPLAARSLSNLAAMLRLNLFIYRELRDWLQHPYHTPFLMPETVFIRSFLAVTPVLDSAESQPYPASRLASLLGPNYLKRRDHGVGFAAQHVV